MVSTLKVFLILTLLIEDLYYMQGNIHLSQFRARVKSNRSGGEDDLTLAIEHFRVVPIEIRLICRKIYYFIRIGGIHGMLSHRRIPSNLKMHWHGQQITLKKTVKRSLVTNEYFSCLCTLTIEINFMFHDGGELFCKRRLCSQGRET